MRQAVVGLALLAALSVAGCGRLSWSPPLPGGGTPDELRAYCERTGGWWRGDLIAGYCEYQAPGFL